MRELVLEAGHRIGVTADTHFRHRRILGYCLRPWLWLNTDNRRPLADADAVAVPFNITDDCLKAHDDALIDRINAVLGSDDVLLHGGDVAWNGRDNLREFRDRLNVKRVYLVVGNHDDRDDLALVFGADYVAERWRVVVKGGPGGKRTAVLDHYPGYSWEGSHKGAWQLFGHVHGNLDNRHVDRPQWNLSLDVGVDSHDYKPWLWNEELVPLFDKRYTAWKAWRDEAYSRRLPSEAIE